MRRNEDAICSTAQHQKNINLKKKNCSKPFLSQHIINVNQIFKKIIMKKICLSFLLVITGVAAFSQDLNKIQILMMQGKVDEAKAQIDKAMADPKAAEKADTWFYKLSVYAEIFADSSLYKKYPDADKQALDALKNYEAKDPTLKTLKENTRPVGLVYSESFNLGRDFFSAKDWSKSFDYFKNATDMSEYVNKNKLRSDGKTSVDTFTVLYTAYAAQNAGNAANATFYYNKLADEKIGGADFEDIYKFILDYYGKQADKASFTKYLATAKELYPSDAALWGQIEMNFETANSGLDELLSKYKASDAGGKLTEDDYITYAETFATNDQSQLSKLDSAKKVEIKLTAAEAFKKAFAMNNSNGLYAYNTGILYYNIFLTLDDRFYGLRGASADLKAQRDQVEKQEQTYSDMALEWLEKGYNILKAKATRERNENVSLNSTVGALSKIYEWKREKSKGVDSKAYDAYDAKMNQYDKERDTYH